MFEQYSLPYSFADLEPYIDELTMETHYTKHHAGYTKNLNAAAERVPAFSGVPIEDVLRNLDSVEDPKLRTTLRNNGGGYYNHNLYFSVLSPNGAKKPTGRLAAGIDRDFGSFDDMVGQLTDSALGRFGSGWAWLSAKPNGTLVVSSSPNQDNPLIEGSDAVPILGVDVWEHAYYLRYRNMRANYVKAFFDVVDWKTVSSLYEKTVG